MVENGSLVKLEYVAYIDGQQVEKPSKPLIVAVGQKQVLPGLDEALLKAELEKEVSVTIPPEKGYGERNPDLVRLVPMELFRRQGIDPVVGMPVELDNMQARVQSVSGGRVRVDFNPELAGKTIDYKFKIVEQLKTPLAKIDAIAKQFLGDSVRSFYEVDFKEAKIEVDSDTCLKQGYFGSKGRMIAMLLAHLDEVKTLKIVEEYAKDKLPLE